MAQDHTAHIGAPVIFQSFFRNGHIVGDLFSNAVPHIFHIQCVNKFHDLGNTQAGFIRQMVFGGFCHRKVQQKFLVFLDHDNIGMMIHDPQADGISLSEHQQVDIKDQLRVRRLNFQLHGLHVGFDIPMFFLRHIADDLQFLLRITHNDTGTDRRRNTVKTAGIWHYHTLNVLDNITADEQLDPVRHAAQHLPCLRCRIGQGDWLRAAHGRLQFLPEDIQILLIQMIAFFHGDSSCKRKLSLIITISSGEINIYPSTEQKKERPQPLLFMDFH